jgi:outer membrane protein assembly factor BamA
MSMSYRYYYTSKREIQNRWIQPFQPNVSTLRINLETAGNLLYAINSLATHRSDVSDNPYKVFGIRYSQYVKGEIDYGFTHTFDLRNSLAFHAGFGIAYPYGNSAILPFEKRFYGGGANGVRGWDVRTLGPGSYNSAHSVSSFINQCGDINLILSAEYRAKLFWFIEGALFVDAGNIWTIHNYESQPGGMFHFNSFWKQIAMAYGAGIRLNFNYFLIRFDMGMKARNPARDAEPWPLIHPRWGRDHSFHFSIGYPF